MSHFITSLTDFIQNLYVATGLLGIVLAMTLESCCIPLPSEIVMPLAGSMLAIGKPLRFVDPNSPLWLNLLLLALSGAIGCLIGSIAAYGIGYAGGRPLMLKYGKYVLISQHDADKADRFFQRWGSPTAFFSRLLPVVRTYISLPAGISKMPFGKFCVYTFLGSLPWCLLLAFLGYQLGQNYDKLSGPLHYLDGVIVVAVVILVVLYVWRHIRNDRRARAEHAAEEAAAKNGQQMSGNNSWGQQQPMQAQRPMRQALAQPPFQGPPPAQQSWGQPAQPPQWSRPPVSPQAQPPQGSNQPGNGWR